MAHTLRPGWTAASVRARAGELTPADERLDRAAGEPQAQHMLYPYIGSTPTPGLAHERTVERSLLRQQAGDGPDPWWYALRANNWGSWSP